MDCGQRLSDREGGGTFILEAEKYVVAFKPVRFCNSDA
jgi:hypothetical protein